MKKLQILILAFLISLSICSLVSIQVKAQSGVSVSISASPSSIDRGFGTSVLSATVSGGTPLYFYQWMMEAPGQSSFTNILGAIGATYTFTPSSTATTGTYLFQVTVTDMLTNSDTSSSVSVTVNPKLVAPIVTPTLGVINQGQTSSLTSSTVSTGTSPYTYQWLQRAPGAGSFSSIIGATSVSYIFVTSGSTATGSWSFELRVTDAASAVVTSDPVNVTVNIVPTVTVLPSSWTMDLGQNKTFSATPSGGSGSYPSTGYQWYVDGAVQSGATTSKFSYIPGSSGFYSITVTVTDSLGTTSAQSSAASVIVNLAPTVSVAPVGPVRMNVGQVQVFNATASGGSGSLSYQWYLDGSAVGSNSPSYSYTAAGSSHSVTCKVSDSASPSVTSPASNAVSITVNVAPTVSIAPGSWIMDVGQTKMFTAVASGGTGTLSYQWYLAGSAVSGQTGLTYAFTASSAGSPTIYCKVTDQASTSVVVQSNTPSVTVNVAPTVSIAPGSWIMDVGQTKMFTATSAGGSGSYSAYQWYVGGVIQSGQTASTFSYSPISAGSRLITVTVTDSLGVTSAQSSAASVTVNIPPLDHFVFSSVGTQTTDTSFSITVTAKDVYGNTVTGYTGTPSLTYSAGSISPSTTNAFVNGVGSTSVTVTGVGSGVTITATDGTHTGISNSFTVTIVPTTTPSPTSAQNPTPTPTIKPIPSPTSTPTPTLPATKITATTDKGAIAYLAINGNITSSDISNVTITTNQSATSTTVSFTITGESGTTGFSNMTIPKTAISYGGNPVVFIDSQQTPNQSFTQDANNFYVWYITQFSTHQVKIQFQTSSTSQLTSFGSVLAIGITVPEIILIYTVIAVRRLRRKPDKT